MHDIVTIHTISPDETFSFGEFLGTQLTAGAIVALVGDLGAGKTWLAKGLARGLNVPEYEYVTSPAYDIVHEYKGSLPVFHIDFYRLEELSQSDRMWIEEYLYREGISIIEWADKFIDDLATEYLKIEINPGALPNERDLSITVKGPVHQPLIEKIRQWKPPSV